MSSAVCFNLDQSKILSSGNALKRLENIKGQEENTNYKHILTFLRLLQAFLPCLKM